MSSWCVGSRYKLLRRLALYAGGAALITALMGLFQNPFYYGLLGVSRRGFPLPWLFRVVYPNAPWTISWIEFLLDLVFWGIILWLIDVGRARRKRREETRFS